ncbi:MAG: hypothetical protein ACI36Z_00425 [Alloprevotella sp.]
MNHIAYTPLQRSTTTYPDLHPLQRPTPIYHDLHPLQALSLWLDRRSATFTRIAGFAVSRRSVIRVHALIVSLAIGVVSLFQAPYLSLASFITAAWLTYRINKTPKSENNNE